MAAQATTLGTALAVTLLGIATTFGSAAHAQGLGGGTTQSTAARANAKPSITGIPSRMLVAGSYYDFRPVASDPDSARLTFSINKKPAWANFDASTGRLYGTPSAIDVGKIKGIQISVSDGEKRAALTKFGIKVIAGQPPVISGTPVRTAVEGQAYQFQASASDSDKQTLQFAIINKPSWANFDKFTGRLYGTPPAGSAGTYASIVISVTDGATTVSLAGFSIEVARGAAVEPPNTAPTISGMPPASVPVGQTYEFTPSANDVDGDTLTFSAVNVPSWLSFDKANGHLSGKPQSGQEGTYADLVVSVNDGEAIAFLGPFSITVTAGSVSKPPVPNAAPTISGTPSTGVGEGKAYAFQPIAADADGDTLAFSVANAPAWLTIDATSGKLGGVAPIGSAGTYSGIVVSVTDGVATVSLPAFALLVTPMPANTPPTIGGTPPTIAKVGQLYSFEPLAADPDGDPLTFSPSGKPAWLKFDIATGRLSGIPTSVNIGTYNNLRISVSDGKAAASLPAFSISVVAVDPGNQPPVISGSPATQATEGKPYSFQPSASDPEGDGLKFSASGLPTWLTFSTVTGAIAGTPPVGTAGSHGPIVISVSDGNSSATLAPFTINVATKVNGAPTIIGSPGTSATVDKVYAFQPTASDPDGQPLAFGIANKPGWANFSVATGQLSGTPQLGDVGTYSNIVISVSDGQANASLPAFTIVVSTVANVAPKISGTPVTSVTVGKAYSFTPTAVDPDGPSMAFGIANKPVWANFNVTTGQLSGTPQAAHAGTYGNIVISVSDSLASATLPAFSITVAAAPGSGTAELSWIAPTQNEDGSPLTNLAGYRIRYGTSAASLTQTVDIPSAQVTSALVESLATGTWYFTVASYNGDGVESVQTEPVYKTIL